MKLGLKALALAAALNGCAAGQNTPESPTTSVDDTRAALAKLGVDQEGIKVDGPFVVATECHTAPSQDTAEQFADQDANQTLDDACKAAAPGGFVPKMQGKRSNSGSTYCVQKKTPVTDTCTGQ